MPKEKVYDTSQLFDVEVGWSLEHDVQLGICTHDGRAIADWLAGQDKPLPHGQSKLPGFHSLWASLDRRQINRLIKMLRKARDETYGRDE